MSERRRWHWPFAFMVDSSETEASGSERVSGVLPDVWELGLSHNPESMPIATSWFVGLWVCLFKKHIGCVRNVLLLCEW